MQYLQEQVSTYKAAVEEMKVTSDMLNSAPEYQLPEPPALMTAKAYKTKFVDKLVDKLKKLAQSFISKYFEIVQAYNRVNQQNGKLYKDNEQLRDANSRLFDENNKLREQNKDYAFLRKVFGNEQIDALLKQAHEKQTMQRGTRHRHNETR